MTSYDMADAMRNVITEQREDIVALKDENARLRSCLSDDVENAKQIMGENVALRQQLADVTESTKRVEERCAKLRELVRGLHMAYVGALNECEGMDAGLIWDHCEMVDAELAKSHARFEVDRHRFDVAMRELGIEVNT